jgi:myosin heavy subunit
MEENKLEIIVKESGLDTTKAQFILKKFQDYFDIAADWEAKAKVLIVADVSQVAEMKLARTGRLFLREKRIAIENARKELKEAALREGQTIDGIAKTLTSLIKPIEDYLEKQEKFAEIKAAEEAEARRIEGERLLRLEEEAKAKKAEEERIAREKVEAEEKERIRMENETLRKEAEERERQMVAEREKAEADHKAIEEKARKEREAAEKTARDAREKADAEKRAIEEQARKEREKQEKALADQKAKAEAEKREQEKERARIQAEADELQRRLDAQVECPYCHARFTPGKKAEVMV